jgi:hypothetical protein
MSHRVAVIMVLHKIFLEKIAMNNRLLMILGHLIGLAIVISASVFLTYEVVMSNFNLPTNQAISPLFKGFFLYPSHTNKMYVGMYNGQGKIALRVILP